MPGIRLAAADPTTGLAHCAGIHEAEPRLACFDGLAAQTAGTVAATTPRQHLPAPEGVPDGGHPSPRPEPSEPLTAEPVPAPEQTPHDRRRFLGIRPYRSNYLLPVSYNASPNRNVPEEERVSFLGDALDKVEMKFQLSFEVPLWTDILHQELDLYFAYTQIAFFQAYNKEYSSPFRDTNYEPELGLHWSPELSALGWRLRSARVSLDHQSNGRADPLSRSWNRLVWELEAEQLGGDLDLALRIWVPLGAKPSDNPDIYDFLDYGELHAGYDLGQHHFGLMFRNPAYPTVQLDWSYPLGETIRLYVQYFNGYGESLLDYDHSVNRISLGFLLNDWP